MTEAAGNFKMFWNSYQTTPPHNLEDSPPPLPTHPILSKKTIPVINKVIPIHKFLYTCYKTYILYMYTAWWLWCMTKVTGSHNQELQQQLRTKKSRTTFNGKPIFQLVKTHHFANKTTDWVQNKKSSETCTADLYIPPSGLHVQYTLFSTIMCSSIQVLGPTAVTTSLL